MEKVFERATKRERGKEGRLQIIFTGLVKGSMESNKEREREREREKAREKEKAREREKAREKGKEGQREGYNLFIQGE